MAFEQSNSLGYTYVLSQMGFQWTSSYKHKGLLAYLSMCILWQLFYVSILFLFEFVLCHFPHILLVLFVTFEHHVIDLWILKVFMYFLLYMSILGSQGLLSPWVICLVGLFSKMHTHAKCHMILNYGSYVGVCALLLTLQTSSRIREQKKNQHNIIFKIFTTVSTRVDFGEEVCEQLLMINLYGLPYCLYTSPL